MSESSRCAFRLGAAQMLIQTRHDLDKIAGAMAEIELHGQDCIPAIFACTGRTRKTEDIGAACYTGGRPGLDG